MWNPNNILLRTTFLFEYQITHLPLPWKNTWSHIRSTLTTLLTPHITEQNPVSISRECEYPWLCSVWMVEISVEEILGFMTRVGERVDFHTKLRFSGCHWHKKLNHLLKLSIKSDVKILGKIYANGFPHSFLGFPSRNSKISLLMIKIINFLLLFLIFHFDLKIPWNSLYKPNKKGDNYIFILLSWKLKETEPMARSGFHVSYHGRIVDLGCKDYPSTPPNRKQLSKLGTVIRRKIFFTDYAPDSKYHWSIVSKCLFVEKMLGH